MRAAVQVVARHADRQCTRPAALAARYRAGSCSGTSNGFVCKACSNQVCGPNQYRSGSCTGTNDGLACLDQPTCTADAEYLVGASPTSAGTCAPCSNARCAPGLKRTGACGGATDGYACVEEATPASTPPTRRSSAPATGPSSSTTTTPTVPKTTGATGAAASGPGAGDTGDAGGGSDSNAAALAAVSVVMALFLVGCVVATAGWWRQHAKWRSLEAALARTKRHKRSTRNAENAVFSEPALPAIPTGGGAGNDEVYAPTSAASSGRPTAAASGDDYAAAAAAAEEYGRLSGARAAYGAATYDAYSPAVDAGIDAAVCTGGTPAGYDGVSAGQIARAEAAVAARGAAAAVVMPQAYAEMSHANGPPVRGADTRAPRARPAKPGSHDGTGAARAAQKKPKKKERAKHGYINDATVFTNQIARPEAVS